MKKLQFLIYLILILSVVSVIIFGIKPFSQNLDPEETLIKEVGIYPNETYRLSDATFLVSVRTSMPNVKAEMVRWWFADFLATTEHYRLWHPADHIWMDWENKEPGEIIGASHLVHEYIGGDLRKLRIQFVNSSEFFGYDANDKDTFVLCARVGSLDIDFNIAKMCHVVVNTEDGAEMRSRFWLGHVYKRKGNEIVFSIANFIANMAIVRFFSIDKKSAEDLKNHASEEMVFLSDLLPVIFLSDKKVNKRI